MVRRKAPLVAVMAASALVLSACGFRDGDDVATGPGVTEEPCPDTPNEDNGCIYLGVISDLTSGPFAALAVPLTDAQAAFWQRVNEDGGIGGYDIDVTTYVRDNEYNPEVHVRVFEEIRADVLALAQSLGSPQTAAILDDLRGDDIVAAPASWTSAWEFEDVIIESGASYCFESMNAVDFAFETHDGIETVMAVHYPGDYGDDAAYGVQVAAEANDAEFVNVETPPGADNQAEAIQAVGAQSPDVVFITTGPLEMATIVGQAAAVLGAHEFRRDRVRLPRRRRSCQERHGSDDRDRARDSCQPPASGTDQNEDRPGQAGEPQCLLDTDRSVDCGPECVVL
jgi:ABC-type branched-subunit amino acid transport system substrate-binding protein